VTAVPGLTPRSPFTMVGPVLVTVELPSTAKLSAVPSDGATAANAAWNGAAVIAVNVRTMRNQRFRVFRVFINSSKNGISLR
jgi:hypothetical protein